MSAAEGHFNSPDACIFGDIDTKTLDMNGQHVAEEIIVTVMQPTASFFETNAEATISSRRFVFGTNIPYRWAKSKLLTTHFLFQGFQKLARSTTTS